jgi:uncharacterized membrane protein HdeD (DUF308 family)
MISMSKELGRLSSTVVWRGLAMLVLGLAAVVWPEDVLIPAMLGVATIALVSGLYEMSIAFAIRRFTPRWRLALGYGVLSVAFGGLSIGEPGVSLRVALMVIASWFVAYGLMTGGTAILLWRNRAVRWSLIGWATFDIALAILVLAYPASTIFSLLFFGAVYAALFGAWQLMEGIWIRRTLRIHSMSFASETSQAPIPHLAGTGSAKTS